MRTLTCFEWTKKTNTKVNVTDQRLSVWPGGKVNGSWMLDVVTAGTYRIELFRYPKEADYAMTQAYPQTQREFKLFPECKALPVTQTRLRIGDFDKSVAIKPTDKHATFELELPVGEIEMRTWLFDNAGEELCGAYYVEVTKL